ncbi:uncharacterized protein [Equus caballus]|uniref:uncharacterized protein n=1 Tax=Equus caballus TaxID=9796 RepID=UPI0038B28D50
MSARGAGPAASARALICIRHALVVTSPAACLPLGDTGPTRPHGTPDESGARGAGAQQLGVPRGGGSGLGSGLPFLSARRRFQPLIALAGSHSPSNLPTLGRGVSAGCRRAPAASRALSRASARVAAWASRAGARAGAPSWEEREPAASVPRAPPAAARRGRRARGGVSAADGEAETAAFAPSLRPAAERAGPRRDSRGGALGVSKAERRAAARSGQSREDHERVVGARATVALLPEDLPEERLSVLERGGVEPRGVRGLGREPFWTDGRCRAGRAGPARGRRCLGRASDGAGSRAPARPWRRPLLSHSGLLPEDAQDLGHSTPVCRARTRCRTASGHLGTGSPLGAHVFVREEGGERERVDDGRDRVLNAPRRRSCSS